MSYRVFFFILNLQLILLNILTNFWSNMGKLFQPDQALSSIQLEQQADAGLSY